MFLFFGGAELIICWKQNPSQGWTLLLLFVLHVTVNNVLQVCEIEPSLLRSCEERLKDVQGRVEVLSVSTHVESGPSVEQHDSVEVPQAAPVKEPDAVAQISETMQKHSISTESQGNAQGKQQRRCKECDVLVEDKLYREHCKSGWHKHNYTRHKNGLPPLSQEECMVEMELADSKKDLKDYDFWWGYLEVPLTCYLVFGH